MTILFRPWTMLEIVKDALKTIEKWDAMDDEDKRSGDWINPDEPEDDT